MNNNNEGGVEWISNMEGFLLNASSNHIPEELIQNIAVTLDTDNEILKVVWINSLKNNFNMYRAINTDKLLSIISNNSPIIYEMLSQPLDILFDKQTLITNLIRSLHIEDTRTPLQKLVSKKFIINIPFNIVGHLIDGLYESAMRANSTFSMSRLQ